MLELSGIKLLHYHKVRLRMASHSKLFSISYSTLLASIADELGWSEPIYNLIDTEQNGVYVLLRRTHSPIAYYFSGASMATKAESKEDAAEQAVDYLVQKKRVIVDDVNLEKRQMYKACSRFYKDKSMAFELIKGVPPRLSLSKILDLNNHPLGNTPKIVAIDFWSLLLQIVAAFKIDVTEVEELEYDNGTHVCSLRINWENSYNKVSYFIGECSADLDQARQSLAKKMVCYLESVFGFGVKDANYYGMLYAEMRCAVQRQRCLAARDKLEKEMMSLTPHSTDECATPVGPIHQITSGLTLPPPPKKLKTIWGDTSSSATSKEPIFKMSSVDSMLLGTGRGVSVVAHGGVQ